METADESLPKNQPKNEAENTPKQEDAATNKHAIIWSGPGKNKKQIIILAAIATVLVLGLAGIFIYNVISSDAKKDNDKTQVISDPIIENDDESRKDSGGSEIKDEGNDKNQGNSSNQSQTTNFDEINKDLIYPAVNDHVIGPVWNFKNISINNMGRPDMMESAAIFNQLKNRSAKDASAQDSNGNYYVSATEIEKNFKKVFGPDTKYTNGDIYPDSGNPCFFLGSYNSSKNAYFVATQCGGSMPWWWTNQTRLYKAEKNDDYIYTYFYVQPYLVDEMRSSGSKAYLYKRQLDDNYYTTNKNLLDTPINFTKEVDYSKVESTINSMMDKGEVDTYMFTFKKQSDGKYYFHSGSWK